MDALFRTSPVSRVCLSWLPVAVLLSAGVALMLSVSPSIRPVPGRDSGVFLYVASTVLDGGLPYRDVWDHKPPAIYYLDALGLALSERSLWGVWTIQTLFVCSAVAIGYVLMKEALGIVPALFGSVAWLSTLGLLLIWENYPEEYALPLQFASIYLFYKMGRSQQTFRRRTFMMGLLGVLIAACFLLKPTLLGTQLAIVVLLLFRNLSSTRRPVCALSDLAPIAVGVLLVLTPVTVYFWSQGVLDEMLDAVFRYGALYSAAPVWDRLLAVLSGLGGLPALSGAPAIALISWVSLCRHRLKYRSRRRARDPSLSVVHAGSGNNTHGHEALSSVALVALPLELLLVSVPGRSYAYYYTSWLPVLAILCGLFAYHLVNGDNGRNAWVRSACLCAFLPVMIGLPGAVIVDRVSNSTGTAETRVEAVRYIAANTSSTDTVLIWGVEPGVNFAAQRHSPTRFVYQYPLYTREYVDAALVKEFLRDLETNRPSLIIDASSSDKITPPIDTRTREKWVPTLVYHLPPEMNEVLQYAGSHYELVGTLGPDRWQVYASNAP